jgi:hypothetical protein
MSNVINERKDRENAMFNNRVIDLLDAKDILIQNIIKEKIDISLEYFINNTFSDNLYEKYAFYLHALIMFKEPVDVHTFLKKHYNGFGKYATEMFVNYPIISHMNKNVITPLMCAMLWSDNPQMVRVLYYWGADTSLQDINGKYPEEKYGTYYINHLNSFLARNYFVIGLRCVRNFIPIIEELRFISGEKPPPLTWEHPGRAYSNLTNSVTQQSSTYNASTHA